jgi:hypothetical protein
MTRRFRPTAATALALLCACSAPAPTARPSATPTSAAVASPSATEFPAAYEKGTTYAPSIDPANFVVGVDNPYFPLVPGTRWVMRAHGDDAGEVTITRVTAQKKPIMGIRCVVVRDEVDTDGRLKELTHDWYAQDVDGNVWYMGEQTAEYRNGKVASDSGSWEAGVDGAMPGIIMPASPIIGLTYRQEFLEGEAEDLARVVDTSGAVTTPFRAFADMWITEDWTPLEPSVVERKFYARGVGLVAERLVKGGSGTNLLTGYRSGS